MTSSFNDLMTIAELAALKKVQPRTVFLWLKKGIAPANKRLGDRTFFIRSAAEAFTPPKRGGYRARRKTACPAVP
jgi:hypothetical protein